MEEPYTSSWKGAVSWMGRSSLRDSLSHALTCSRAAPWPRASRPHSSCAAHACARWRLDSPSRARRATRAACPRLLLAGTKFVVALAELPEQHAYVRRSPATELAVARQATYAARLRLPVTKLAVARTELPEQHASARRSSAIKLAVARQATRTARLRSLLAGDRAR